VVPTQKSFKKGSWGKLRKNRPGMKVQNIDKPDSLKKGKFGPRKVIWSVRLKVERGRRYFHSRRNRLGGESVGEL